MLLTLLNSNPSSAVVCTWAWPEDSSNLTIYLPPNLPTTLVQPTKHQRTLQPRWHKYHLPLHSSPNIKKTAGNLMEKVSVKTANKETGFIQLYTWTSVYEYCYVNPWTVVKAHILTSLTSLSLSLFLSLSLRECWYAISPFLLCSTCRGRYSGDAYAILFY